MDSLTKEIDDFIDKELRKTALLVYRNVTLNTPVDTGRARELEL